MMKHSIERKLWLLPMLAAAMMLCAACALAQAAVVDNGSDPLSLLNLREQPDRSAAVIGRFLSGAQVEVVSSAGDWSEVVIGTGMGKVKGFVMTQYLAQSARADATYTAVVASPYGTQSVVLRDGPSNSYDAVAMLRVGDGVLVIGEMNEFRFVRTGNGCVGCLLGSELR